MPAAIAVAAIAVGAIAYSKHKKNQRRRAFLEAAHPELKESLATGRRGCCRRRNRGNDDEHAAPEMSSIRKEKEPNVTVYTPASTPPLDNEKEEMGVLVGKGDVEIVKAAV